MFQSINFRIHSFIIVFLCSCFSIHAIAQELEGVVYYKHYTDDTDVPDFFYTKEQWEALPADDKEVLVPLYFSKDRLKIENMAFTYIFKNGLQFVCYPPELNMLCDSVSVMRTNGANAKIVSKKEMVWNYSCIHIQTHIPNDYGSYQVDDYWYSPAHYLVDGNRYAKYKQTSLGYFYSIGKNIPLRLHMANGYIKLQAVFIEEKWLPDSVFVTK